MIAVGFSRSTKEENVAIVHVNCVCEAQDLSSCELFIRVVAVVVVVLDAD